MMMCLTKGFSATLAIALLASTAAAADTVASGKVKSINADNKTFVLTDAANADFTFKLGDHLVVNRAGKESKSNLKSGDAISICYDKGAFTWTAHYILVQEGTAKNCELIRGNVKGYDADRKELTFTNEVKKDSTYSMGKAMVRLNMADAQIENVRIGDHALLIVDTVDGKSTLHSVMVDRAK
jgi:Cu/Ag efflux protein CusF